MASPFVPKNPKKEWPDFALTPGRILHGDYTSKSRALEALPYYLAKKVYENRTWDPPVSSPEFANLFHFDSRKAHSWFGHWRGNQSNQLEKALETARELLAETETRVSDVLDKFPQEMQELGGDVDEAQILRGIEAGIDNTYENAGRRGKKLAKADSSDSDWEETSNRRKQPKRKAREPAKEATYDEEPVPQAKKPKKIVVETDLGSQSDVSESPPVLAAPSVARTQKVEIEPLIHRNDESSVEPMTYYESCEALLRDFNDISGDFKKSLPRIGGMVELFADRVAVDDEVTGVVVIQRSGIYSCIPLTFAPSRDRPNLGAVIPIPWGVRNSLQSPNGFTVKQTGLQTRKGNIKYGFAVGELKIDLAQIGAVARRAAPVLERPTLVLIVGVGTRTHRSGIESSFEFMFADVDAEGTDKNFAYGLVLDQEHAPIYNEPATTVLKRNWCNIL